MSLHHPRRGAILPLVVKPNRYAGVHGIADPSRFGKSPFHAAVVHPDRFETGIGDRTTRECWSILNSLPGVAADLAFAPWDDLDRLLAAGEIPYWAIETGRPLSGFDLLVVTPATPLQLLAATRILHLAGLRLRAEERGEDAPIVVALGTGIANAEPFAAIADASLPGEAGALLPELVARLSPLRGAPRRERLEALRSHPAPASGATAPHLLAGAAWPGEAPPIIPGCESEHDAFRLDIRRGSAGHRFEFHWRGEREAVNRGVEEAVTAAADGLRETGLEWIELAGDHPEAHPELLPLVETLMRRFPAGRIGFEDWGTLLPGAALAREVARGRRLPFTWSVWAGSESLRGRLGVRGRDDEILFAVETAVRGGASLLRLRFGLGWPGESDGDRVAIVRFVRAVRERVPSGEAPPRIRVELIPFTPHPRTEFAPEAMLDPASWSRLAASLAGELEEGATQARPLPPERALIEAHLGRAGREAAEWMIAAAERGSVIPDPIPAQESAGWMPLLAMAGLSPDRPLPRLDPSAIGKPAAPIMVAPTVTVPSNDSGASSPGGSHAAGYGRRGKRRLSAADRPSARYRLRFGKEELLRFTSHLDVTRAFERAIHRLGHASPAWRGKAPKLSFGPPLPLGWTGEDEHVDLQFADEVTDAVPRALADLLPEGLAIHDIRPIRASVESLAHAIDRAHYEVTFPPEFLAPLGLASEEALPGRLADGVRHLLESRELMAGRPTAEDSKQHDIRPGLLAAEAVPGAHGVPTVRFRVTLGTPGSARPDQLLLHLFAGSLIEPRLAHIHRRALRIAGSAREFTPLEVVELDFPWWRETGRRSAAGQGS